MEFLFSALLLGLNLLDYEYDLPKPLFFVAGLGLFCALFYCAYIRNRDFKTACIALMCYTWPISWINVFGDPTGELQLPWFYLLGAMLVLNAVAEFDKIRYRKVSSVVLGVFVTLMIVFIYPLFLSPSLSKGLNELIMIGFFLVLCFIAFLNSDSLSREQRESIINAYLWAVVASSVLIIFQWAYYYVFEEAIFKFTVGNYNGRPMLVSNLLMEDTSSATIMLGSGIFFMLERFNRKEKRFFYIVCMFITVIGMALTTRRTSILSLVICLCLYVMFYYKKTGKKIIMTVLFSAVVAVMMYYLMVSRPAESYGAYLDDNGRFAIYMRSIALFFENPFGIGYDNDNLALLCGGIIPHSTILRWLNMAGIVFTLLILFLLGYMVVNSWRKQLKDEFWVLLYCLLAMNFIPDIINARFFVIPCMLSFLVASNKSREEGIKLRKV